MGDRISNTCSEFEQGERTTFREWTGEMNIPANELESVPLVIEDLESGRVVDCTPGFERLVGMSVDQMRRLETAELDQMRTEGRYPLIRDGGSYRSAIGSATTRRELQASTITVADRTLRVSVFREESREANERTQEELMRAQKLEALGLMAAGIAHDFNNTLMAALPWAELLRRKYENDEMIVRAADHIRRAVFRAAEGTKQLLDFAQPRKPQKKRVDLASIVRQQTKVVRPAIPAEIAVHVETKPLNVRVDPGQVGQVLLNLMLNARDAMAGGGDLFVEVREIDESEAARWQVTKRSAVLVIRDTGAGMSETTRNRIFDPFFTTKELGKGTGLGLSVAHRVIDQNDGRLIVESEEGVGTTCYVILPLDDGEIADETDAKPPQTPARRREIDVVVVDDDEAIAAGIALGLESYGARITALTRGADLLQRIDARRVPNLIVMDFSMPGMRGDELHREIRARLPDVPIIISSGYDNHEAIEKLREDRHTRFRRKPYDVEELFLDYDEMQKN